MSVSILEALQNQELEEMEAQLKTLDDIFQSQSIAARASIFQANKAIESMEKTWQLWRKLADEIKAQHQEILKASPIGWPS